MKTAYNRGIGHIPGCKKGTEKSGLLCYPPCPRGSNGVGPVCWGYCPKATKACGVLCLNPKRSCLGAILDKITKVTELATSIAGAAADPAASGDVIINALNTVKAFHYPKCKNYP